MNLSILSFEDSEEYSYLLDRMLKSFSKELNLPITLTVCNQYADKDAYYSNRYDLVLMDWSFADQYTLELMAPKLNTKRICILTGNCSPSIAQFAISHSWGLIYKDPIDKTKNQLLNYIKGI